MTIRMYEDDSNLHELKSLRLYALRVGRMFYLKYFCADDHPVLSTEKTMVEMARSKLLEQIYALPKSRMYHLKPHVESVIVKVAHEWLKKNLDDEDQLQKIIEEIKTEVGNLIPVFH